MGTVPTGTVLALMIAFLIAEISPPVLRSITVSAPKSMAACNFLSSVSKSQESEDVPIFALTFVFNPAHGPVYIFNSVFGILGALFPPISNLRVMLS